MKKICLALCLVFSASSSFAANTQGGMEKFAVVAAAGAVPGVLVAAVGAGMAKFVVDNRSEILAHLLPAAATGAASATAGKVVGHQSAASHVSGGAVAAAMGYGAAQGAMMVSMLDSANREGVDIKEEVKAAPSDDEVTYEVISAQNGMPADPSSGDQAK